MNKDCQHRRIVDADAIVKLKKKAIKDFNKFLYTLFKGYKGNYKQLLNEINFIETYQDLDNQKLIYEYYLNNGMQ